jgi:HEAT repeat protein
MLSSFQSRNYIRDFLSNFPSNLRSKIHLMNWLTGSKQGEAKKLIGQLADATKRERAAQDLIRLGAAAVPSLIEALQTKDENLLPRYQQILARIPPATSSLIKILSEAHPILRGRVAEIFGISKDRTAVPPLLDALRGEFYTVRSRAALALGQIGDRQAIRPLLSALKDTEGEVRGAACLALGLFRDPATFDEITNVLLDDPIIEVRQAAARALGNTQHPAALPYLMEALHDSFWWYEREYAAGDLLAAIEKMGDAAVEPLIEALAEKEGTVRKFAAILLGKLGNPRAIEPLGMTLYDMHHEVGKASAESLARFGASAADVLIEALKHPEMWIRIHSVIALSKIKDARVAPLLLQMLNDPEREVKKQVIQSLGELKDRSVIPALQEIASHRADRELHTLAKEVIARMN